MNNVSRYFVFAVIASFRSPDIRMLYETGKSRRIPSNIQRIALRKLKQLQASVELNDLAVPPGNRLEALGGDRKGQHSIRINDQYRVCFIWNEGKAHNVEIVDYH
jgi:proteic killer suppression protein